QLPTLGGDGMLLHPEESLEHGPAASSRARSVGAVLDLSAAFLLAREGGARPESGTDANAKTPSRRAACAAVHALSHSAAWVWQSAQLERAYRAEGSGTLRPRRLPSDSSGTGRRHA